MKDEAPFGRILASLHEAALDPARWPGFSAVVDEALGVHGGSLMFGDGQSSEDARIAFFWTCSHGERRLDLERLYHGTYYPLDERVPRLRHAPDGQLFHNTDVLTERELKTSPVQHAFREVHCGNAVNVRLDRPRGSRILWMVLAPDAAQPTELDVATVAETLHFTRAGSQAAVLLARGMTVREIAAATGRRESTVRSHVKHMFTKHGLNRQADLVRLVRSLAGVRRGGPDAEDVPGS